MLDDAAAPYISVVVPARNDDHGGKMLGRMQAFLDAWFEQAERYGLRTEIVVVEWNPPPERPRLRECLKWPAGPRVCELRFLEVPSEVHRRFRNSRAIPLHQMIAKNAGIRRARGEFVLATNLDTICSAELVRFFAARQLERRTMYRIDRHDVASSFPPGVTADETLAFCQTHVLRIFTRDGAIEFAPDGLRVVERRDIVPPAAGIRLGRGWYHLESLDDAPYRWIAAAAEVIFEKPASTCRLAIDLETGPSTGGQPLAVEIADAGGRVVAGETIEGRCTLRLYFPGALRQGRFYLRTPRGGVPLTRDPRWLNLRVFGLRWEPIPEDSPAYPRHDVSIGLDFPESGLVELTVDQRSGPPLEDVSVTARDAAGNVVFDTATGGGPGALEPGDAVNVPSGLHLTGSAAAGKPGRGGPRWLLEVVQAAPARDWNACLQAPSPAARHMADPAYIHMHACGDFTLLAREDWFALRGYPEFPIWPMHLDALFCFAAHHSGIREVVLEEPMRLYHIQHLSGAGWTPEGEEARLARIEAKGVRQMPWVELVQWIDLMRRFSGPVIFGTEDWGLANETLAETPV